MGAYNAKAMREEKKAAVADGQKERDWTVNDWTVNSQAILGENLKQHDQDHKKIDLPPTWQAWLAKSISDDVLDVKWANSYANALLDWTESDDGQKYPNARIFKSEIEFLSEISDLKQKWAEVGGSVKAQFGTMSDHEKQRKAIQTLYTEIYTKYFSDDAVTGNTEARHHFNGEKVVKKKYVYKDLNTYFYEGLKTKIHERGESYNYVEHKWMVPLGNGDHNVVIIDPNDPNDIWASVVNEVIHVQNNKFAMMGSRYPKHMKEVLAAQDPKLVPVLTGFHQSEEFAAWSKAHREESTAHEVFANEVRFSADESYDLPQSASGGYYPHSASVFDANGYYPPSPYGYALPGMAAPQDPVSALMPIVLVLLLCVCTAVCGFVVCCAGTVCGYVSRKYVGIEMSQMRSKNLRGGVGDEADLQV